MSKDTLIKKNIPENVFDNNFTSNKGTGRVGSRKFKTLKDLALESREDAKL